MSNFRLLQIKSEGTGSIIICDIPTDLTDISNMSHPQLLEVLKFCPASQFYGYGAALINEQTMKVNRARNLVIQLSRDFQMQLVGQISERAESQEQDDSESSKKSTS